VGTDVEVLDMTALSDVLVYLLIHSECMFEMYARHLTSNHLSMLLIDFG